MIIPISFKLQRPHVEAISGEFFRMWRLQMAGKARELEDTELDDNLILWATWLQTMQELDKYFADRVRSIGSKEIKISISMAQCLCLYRAVMHLPLDKNEWYLLHVRTTLLECLFAHIIKLPIKIKPVNRPRPALEDYQWEE